MVHSRMRLRGTLGPRRGARLEPVGRTEDGGLGLPAN